MLVFVRVAVLVVTGWLLGCLVPSCDVMVVTLQKIARVVKIFPREI